MTAVLLAERATGLLRTFNQAGVLVTADVHIADRIGRLGREPDETVRLALALAVRAIRNGSVCVDLRTLSRTVAGAEPAPDLPWPGPEEWLLACAASPLVARGDEPGRPMRLEDGLLYLDRYWRQEEYVRTELAARAAADPPVDLDRLRSALDRLFPGPGTGDRQRLAAAVCALRWVSVVAGGPGTGKTTTVARLLALLRDQPGRPPRIALAAPTGKAAARLSEAVREVELPPDDRAALGELTASTLHRLLGSRRGPGARFWHDRTNRLPFDVVVVDETSMVPLTLMARLLEAVRGDARLVLVGDPDQLASVEAGAVLGDLVHADGAPRPGLTAQLNALGVTEPVVNGVVTLDRQWRFGGSIAPLAQAIQAGDADAALAVLRTGAQDVVFIEPAAGGREPAGLDALRADVVGTARAMTDAALAGDVDGALARLTEHRLLCAHRSGPWGVERWSARIESWLAAEVRRDPADGDWYPGRPLLVTVNDYEVGVFNGDTGVVVRTVNEGARAVFARGGTPVRVAPVRLSSAQTLHAMTVHRGQGSQFARVSFLLPPPDSPLLTRELLYTAVTRASALIRLIGTEDAVRKAVATPIARASGLRHRLVM